LYDDLRVTYTTGLVGVELTSVGEASYYSPSTLPTSPFEVIITTNVKIPAHALIDFTEHNMISHEHL
jgi:hypothetical protein